MATFRGDDDHRHTDLEACQAEVDDLRAMIRSRPVIDQAKGILMAQHDCRPDEAFGLLADASQRSNRKLREVAASIVAGYDEAALPEGDEQRPEAL